MCSVSALPVLQASERILLPGIAAYTEGLEVRVDCNLPSTLSSLNHPWYSRNYGIPTREREISFKDLMAAQLLRGIFWYNSATCRASHRVHFCVCYEGNYFQALPETASLTHECLVTL